MKKITYKVPSTHPQVKKRKTVLKKEKFCFEVQVVIEKSNPEPEYEHIEFYLTTTEGLKEAILGGIPFYPLLNVKIEVKKVKQTKRSTRKHKTSV